MTKVKYVHHGRPPISAGDVFCHDVFGAVILSKKLPGRKAVKQVKVTNDTVICYAIAYR